MLDIFTIEFTNKATELTNEDIERIRSICTQAGIALYHADLFLDLQELSKEKEQIIVNVKNSIENPIHTIIECSEELSDTGIEEKQKKYLNCVINSCNQLLDLTKNITNGVLDT